MWTAFMLCILRAARWNQSFISHLLCRSSVPGAILGVPRIQGWMKQMKSHLSQNVPSNHGKQKKKKEKEKIGKLLMFVSAQKKTNVEFLCIYPALPSHFERQPWWEIGSFKDLEEGWYEPKLSAWIRQIDRLWICWGKEDGTLKL